MARGKVAQFKLKLKKIYTRITRNRLTATSRINCSPIFDSRDKIIVENSPDADAQLRGETHNSTVNRSKSSLMPKGNPRLYLKSYLKQMEALDLSTCPNPVQACYYIPPSISRTTDEKRLPSSMIHDSVPHVLTVFITRILLTAWSIYSLWRTEWQQAVFQQAIEAPGTSCSAAMFGVYFSTRILYEIPDIILNCSALGISAFLSWTLLRTYNAEVFTCVGAPKAITKLYKYFLALQVCLQLEAFVLITAAALWVDQLFNTYIQQISAHTTVYEVLVISYAVALGPWLLAAWFGIRSEKRLLTLAFIFVGSLFILGSSLMFISQVYRWTFYAWPCLGCFITASLVLLVASVVLGILCYTNFGKGLAQYLYVEASLSSSNFAPEVFDRDVESTYIVNFDDKKLKAKGLQADFTTHYLPTLGSIPSRDSASSE
ncbi:hypothetical protein LENED_003360 [Lentinula edodes]|uniref:Uncharacterized protein n=1 Tax=Lentinula edodes TaxID=5353 RepID=A0A1Q3E400_LENED|nr:hypothetical protein LENED_003360 [Lentinula edodes]